MQVGAWHGHDMQVIAWNGHSMQVGAPIPPRAPAPNESTCIGEGTVRGGTHDLSKFGQQSAQPSVSTARQMEVRAWIKSNVKS